MYSASNRSGAYPAENETPLVMDRWGSMIITET